MLILWSTMLLKLFIISNEFLWAQVILHIGYVICKYNLISSLLWCLLLLCPSALRPWNGLIQSNKLVTPKTVVPLLHQGSQSGSFMLYHSTCTVGQNYCQVSSLRRLKKHFLELCMLDGREGAFCSVSAWFLYVLQPRCVVSLTTGIHHFVLVENRNIGNGLYCFGSI